MTTVVLAALGAFVGALGGTTAGAVLVWRRYLHPRVLIALSRPPRAPRSQGASPTAVTPGFVPHAREVTVGRVRFGGVKRYKRL